MPQAVADLESIFAFVARDSEHYAALLVEGLVASVGRLGDFPQSGRAVPERQGTNLREVIDPPYRIVYCVAGAKVHILTVFRSSRMLPPIPTPR